MVTDARLETGRTCVKTYVHARARLDITISRTSREFVRETTLKRG